jgi:glycolate oxidase
MTTEKIDRLFEALKSVVGPQHVSKEEFVRRSYTRGPFQSLGGGTRGKTPGIVVRPGTTEEISQIVKLANETLTPIVPKGGSGSVSAFPPPHVGGDDNILLDTTRMNRIAVDVETMTVTAECGAILANVQAEAKKEGFHFFAVDVPIHMDTIGGVCSGFLGGGEPSDMATSGTMNDYLLGLKVVLPTGEIIQTGGGPGTNVFQKKFLHREAGSPDITGLFVGDGGSFGIKTEAIYTMHPFPTSYLPGIYEMDSEENMWKAYNHLVTTDPYPYTRLLAFHEKAGTWFMVYVIRGHSDAETKLKREILDGICRSYGGVPATLTDKTMEIASMFSARRLGQQVLRVGSAMTYFGEGLVPRPATLDYLRDLNQLIDRELTDLDIIKHVDFSIPYLRAMTITGVLLYFGKKTTRDEVSERIYRKAFHEFHEILYRKYGGFTESCQGESAALNASAWSPTYKAFMKTLKNTLDPNNILMPDLWRI